MKIDVLVAEIGSTTTIVNAFLGIHTKKPVFFGQGVAPTSVALGNVTIGLKQAIEDLKNKSGEPEIIWDEMLATSSAAGGLRMSVHGLVYDMTVRAAREAALGAGAIVKYVTAGKLHSAEVQKVKDINPNIILVAGGVDYGERETALYNFRLLAEELPEKPFIYAGNVQNHDEIRMLALQYGIKLTIVENVYPRVDMLNVEPTRKIIHDVFEEHIVHAPGMSEVRTLINGPIIPTPGAVMLAAQMLYEDIGDLLVFDIGGATTDVHSVTDGSSEVKNIMISPEPLAKRTVEGDLGVYINIPHIVEKIGLKTLLVEFPDAKRLIQDIGPIPQTPEEVRFIERLTVEAELTALERHAGTLRDLYGPTGKRTVAEGKDLTAVKYIIGTGGALTRLPGRKAILDQSRKCQNGVSLYPPQSASICFDNAYIMASLGVLSKRHKDAALMLLKNSLLLS